MSTTYRGIKNQHCEFKGKWHPYPDEKPYHDGKYLVTVKDNLFYKSNHKPYVTNEYYYIEYDKIDDDTVEFLAWAELPEPYEVEENNE